MIARLRLLDGIPRAIHRAYLNPALFPPTFLSDYDFVQGSLLDAYNHCGYRIESRRTTLRARMPSAEETATLQIGSEPVLSASQVTQAVSLDDTSPVVLEVMEACYHDWDYEILNRGEATSARASGRTDV